MGPPFRAAVALLAFFVPSAALGGGAPAAVEPTDGMRILTSTVFVPGSYALPHGVVIVADGVTLDLGGARLSGDGSGSGAGVTAVGVRNVTVTSTQAGGALTGYFYGLVLVNVTDVLVSALDLSRNWLDPAANTTWLDINAAPSLTDKTNLGGGAFLQNATRATVAGCTASHQANGFDVYDSTAVTIRGNVASFNVGWGVHFHGVTASTISRNVLDHNIRENDGDSAGILLVHGSHLNVVADNSCQYSGDGFFIGNENGCPSNWNVVERNDCSHAAANAFEATFSNGNVFRGNRASYSSYGFWLGYSYNSTVEGNTLLGNGCGVDIDHGQQNVIRDNLITNTNGPGVQLTSDGSGNFPQPCLALPNQTVSSTTKVTGNRFSESNNFHLVLVNTTDSAVFDNVFGPNLRPGTISADNLTTVSTRFQIGAAPVELTWPLRNVVGGSLIGGNWYVDYLGSDTTGDGIGDTDVPYVAGGAIKGGSGDALPLKIPNSP
jgi:parallel beta-helix repeat protein